MMIWGLVLVVRIFIIMNLRVCTGHGKIYRLIIWDYVTIVVILLIKLGNFHWKINDMKAGKKGLLKVYSWGATVFYLVKGIIISKRCAVSTSMLIMPKTL